MYLKAKKWYNDCVVTPIQTMERGNGMDYIFTIAVTVAAQVIAYFLCKWLDSHTKKDN